MKAAFKDRTILFAVGVTVAAWGYLLWEWTNA